jgi:CRISPR/Cas system-associated endoribonuclease Cas2
MARILNKQSIKILKAVSQMPGITARALFDSFSRSQPYKDFYNNLYRLLKLELLERKDTDQGMAVYISSNGLNTMGRLSPEKDGVWKLLVFDIPEKHKYVRAVLRAKLKSLHFKKWQNSIWVSPYKLDEEIEAELNQLANKFFVRLIKTTEINNIDDLQKLFP